MMKETLGLGEQRKQLATFLNHLMVFVNDKIGRQNIELDFHSNARQTNEDLNNPSSRLEINTKLKVGLPQHPTSSACSTSNSFCINAMPKTFFLSMVVLNTHFDSGFIFPQSFIVFAS